MNRIGQYSLEEYVQVAKVFHGSLAPGIVIGGFMVDLALRHLPHDEIYDALCETKKCLPDAIQILTPCTIGNGWLKVIDLGRFALALYEKKRSNGIRVFLDAEKLETWPEIKTWFFKLKPKKEQQRDLLIGRIKEAGSGICSIQHVRIHPNLLLKQHQGGIVRCPHCNKAYPALDGTYCLACQGENPYPPAQTLDSQLKNDRSTF